MMKKMFLLSRIGLVLAVAAMVFLVLSFETAQAQETDTDDNVTTLEEMQPGIPQISGQRAREIALELLGHGTARDVLLFEENGVLIFEVEIRYVDVRYMVYVNAISGNVVRMSRHEDGYQGITTLPEVVPPIVLPPEPTPPPGGIHTTARLNEAGAAAIRENGGRGLIRHIGLSRERRVDVYHVRLYDNGTRVDIYLNRNDLTVERSRSRQHSSASSSSRSFQRRQMNITPMLSFNQAADAALTYFDGGTIRDVSRSFIGGRNNTTAVFNVSITTTSGERRSVYVDLHTGEILDHRRG
jgi:uncharacterized membrane protein YkoI